MILDVIVADTRTTINNDRYTAEALQDVADRINKNPDKYGLFESLSGTKRMGSATKASFDGKRLHVYFKINKPYVTIAGNLPGDAGISKPDAFSTLEIKKLEDFRFGFSAKPSFKYPHAFKVSGSVCSKCFSVDVTEEDEIRG